MVVNLGPMTVSEEWNEVRRNVSVLGDQMRIRGLGRGSMTSVVALLKNIYHHIELKAWSNFWGQPQDLKRLTRPWF